MRILHTVPGRNWGGLEQRVVLQSVWLREHGYSVGIATPLDGATWRQAQAAAIETVAIEFGTQWLVASISALRRAVRERDVSIIDCHANADSKAALLCRDRAAIVRSVHVTPTARTSVLLRAKWQWGFDHVISTARSIEDRLRQNGFLAPGRSGVIGEWAEPAFFTIPHRDKADDRLVDVAVVGMLRPDKGQDLALDAFELLRRRSVEARLTIAGGETGDNAAFARVLETRTNRGPLACIVHMTGYCDDVAGLLAKSDVVLIPSRQEAQSRVAAQAMAAGRPVVAFNVGGLSELVRHGATGWLVSPGDIDQLARKVEAIVRDPVTRHEFGRAARKLAEHELRMDAKMDRTVEVYEQACRFRANIGR